MNKVLRLMRELGTAHPRDIERIIGKSTVKSGWGAEASTSRMMLEALHQKGLLRVAKREAGQRIYAFVAPSQKMPPLRDAVRAEGLARLLTNLYAPMPERSLRQLLGLVRGPTNPHPRDGLTRLIKKGELRRAVVENEAWIWPADEPTNRQADDRVRLLAPFDPVVWDRRRFSILWNWEYRFEAYTPVEKRKLGYYALPLLYREHVIGWANVSVKENHLDVNLGFCKTRPRAAAFCRALDEELALLSDFLALPQREVTAQRHLDMLPNHE